MPHLNFSSAFNNIFYLYAIFWLAIAIVHIGFAIGIAHDIRLHQTSGRTPFAGGIFLWFLATLIGGIFVAVAYWLITYSALNPRIARSIASQPKGE